MMCGLAAALGVLVGHAACAIVWYFFGPRITAWWHRRGWGV